MTDSDYVPFLINDRSSALLHLIDAFQFTGSELSDVYDGVFNRMKEHFAPDNTDKPLTPYDVKAVREYVATLKAKAANQEYIEDYVDNIPENTDPLVLLDGEVVQIQEIWDDTFTGEGGQRDRNDEYVDDFE